MCNIPTFEIFLSQEIEFILHTHTHIGDDDGGIWRLILNIMWLHNVPPDTGNSQKSGTVYVCVFEERNTRQRKEITSQTAAL